MARFLRRRTSMWANAPLNIGAHVGIQNAPPGSVPPFRVVGVVKPSQANPNWYFHVVDARDVQIGIRPFRSLIVL